MVRLEGPAAGREVIPVEAILVVVILVAVVPAEVIRAAVTAVEVMAVADTDAIERQSSSSEWSPSLVGGLTLVRHSLLKRDFGETPELARMQPLQLLFPQPLERPQADLEMLADALAVEVARHAGELDLAIQRLVGDA